MHGTRTFSPAARCFALALVAFASIAVPMAAHAGQSTLDVGVRVVRSDAQRVVPTDIPLPPGAQRLAGAAASTSYVVSGTPQQAARFYHAEMPRLGYRHVHGGDAGATWQGTRYRVHVRLDPVLGTQATTRIVVTADSSS
jgi:hypothetical protein